MKLVRKRLTYANVMSSIAVFLVVAGGSALAANQLGKNSVGAKQLKKNAVTAAKLGKGAVTSSKIAPGAVGSAAINTSGLTVPNAAHADSATNSNHANTADSATNATNAVNAQNAENATNATNFSRYFTTGIVKANAGQTVSLFSNGPFTFSGHCKDLGAGDYEAFITVTTSQASSTFGSEASSYTHADFEPGTEAQVNSTISGTTPESNVEYPSYYGEFDAESPDGKTMLSGELFSGVHYYGASCAFWGHGLSNGV